MVEQGQLQMGLFDQRNLLELSSPAYPGERLVACRNDPLAKLRAHKREDLLAATEQGLQTIQARVEAGKLEGQDAIGVRVGRIINRYSNTGSIGPAATRSVYGTQPSRRALAVGSVPFRLLHRGNPCEYCSSRTTRCWPMR